MEAARIASEFSLEKLPVALCNPENATPRWYNARFFVSAELVNQARCVAESANRELITKSKPTDTSRKLGLRVSTIACRKYKGKGQRTLVFAPPIVCIEQSWQVSYPNIYWRRDGSSVNHWEETRASVSVETTASPFLETENGLYAAILQSRPRSWESIGDSALGDCGVPHLKEDYPYNRICSCAWCSSCCQ